MAPLDLISLLVGVLGTLITVWVAFAGKQLLRPRISVEVGLFPEKLYDAPKHWLSSRIAAIVVGVTALEAQQMVLPLLVRVRNRGNLPVSDVDVVLEFSEKAMIAKAGIVGPVADKLVIIEPFRPEGELGRFQGIAQRRIPVGLVRPGETIIRGEIFQLRAGLLAAPIGADSAEKAEILRQRYSPCEQFRSALEVHISVWSSSMKPVSLSVTLVWLAVKSLGELKTVLVQMARLSAAAGPIKWGLYLFPLFWKRRRLLRDELFEVAMIDTEKVEDLGKALSPDEITNHSEGAVVLRVPPWGLWGESFDIEAKWNGILLRQYKE